MILEIIINLNLTCFITNTFHHKGNSYITSFLCAFVVKGICITAESE